MSDEPAAPTPASTNMVDPESLARLDDRLEDMWRLLSRCIAMSAATAYVAQRIGREQEAKIRAAGLEPAISQSLDVLDEMIGKMDAAFEDAIRRAQQR